MKIQPCIDTTVWAIVLGGHVLMCLAESELEVFQLGDGAFTSLQMALSLLAS